MSVVLRETGSASEQCHFVKNKTVDAKGFDAKTNPGALAKADTKHVCGRLDRIFYGNKTGWTFQGGSSDVDAFQEVFSENLGFNSNINQLREGLQARLLKSPNYQSAPGR